MFESEFILMSFTTLTNAVIVCSETRLKSVKDIVVFNESVYLFGEDNLKFSI